MAKTTYQLVYEIGSDSTRLVVGYFLENKVHVLLSLQTPTDFDYGETTIQDINKAADVVSSLINKATNVNFMKDSNLNIEIGEISSVLPPICLNCEDLDVQTFSGTTLISEVDYKNIISMLIKQAHVNMGSTLVNVVPYKYKFDNVSETSKFPLGKKVNSEIITSARMYSMSSSIHEKFIETAIQSKFILNKKILSPICEAYYLYLNNESREKYFLLNIGKTFSHISLINDSYQVIKTEVILYGGYNITKSISEKLHISMERAEKYKKMFGIQDDPNFKFVLNEKIKISSIGKIIKDELKILLSKVKSSIKEWPDKDEFDSLPIILIGGSSLLYGIKDIIFELTSCEVIVPQLKTIGARDPSFFGVLGAIAFNATNSLDDGITMKKDNSEIEQDFYFEREE